MCVWTRILLAACSFVLLWSSYGPLPNSGLKYFLFWRPSQRLISLRASPLLWEATFPSSCFLNRHFLHCFIHQGWGPSWNNGRLLLLAKLHWGPKLLLLPSLQVSPWDPISALRDCHLTAASPTDYHGGTGESQQLLPDVLSWNLPCFYFKSSVERGDEISWCC